jgi:hypothetical protein
MPAAPANVEDVLRAFDATLQIKDRKEGVAKKHSQDVVNLLKKAGLVITETHSIGSYMRRTLIPPLSRANVNLMLVLSADEHKTWNNAEGAGSVLRRLEVILKHQYPKLRVEMTRRAATVAFPDFRLDVTPALAWHTGGYVIPDASGPMWVHSDPAGFAELLTALDRHHNNLVVPIIRMVKAWSRAAEAELEGYHIECMVHNHFAGSAYSRRWLVAYSQGLHEFFTALPDLLEDRCCDPVYDTQVDAYLDQKLTLYGRDQAIDHAADAAELATGARQQEETGLHKVAIATWRQLFGEGFPG